MVPPPLAAPNTSRWHRFPRGAAHAAVLRHGASTATVLPGGGPLSEPGLGRYRLDEQVGQGGMAVVWRGFDTQLRRVVAVKVLHSHLHAREDVRRRFDREARAIAKLHHPFILDVYDVSLEPSYLVTEFIRGHTLRAFAEAHPFDPPELAVACLIPIAEALEHAHALGVVHRDLKPENVMVREDGVVKLTDFGIAALLDPDDKFTVTGSILGSPAHLAPETIEGKRAEPRADLFSFGTILYWLSCGELPYQAPSPAALLRNILEGKRKDPRLLRPSLSDAQAKVIARCLENDPDARYQTATELKRDLLQLLEGAGFDEPGRELAAFVQDPEARAAFVRERLVKRCLAAGEEQLRARRTSAALASFGRALALDPKNAVAQGQVDRIRRRERLLRLAQRSLLAALLVAAVVAGATQVFAAVQRARARDALAASAAAIAGDPRGLAPPRAAQGAPGAAPGVAGPGAGAGVAGPVAARPGDVAAASTAEPGGAAALDPARAAGTRSQNPHATQPPARPKLPRAQVVRADPARPRESTGKIAVSIRSRFGGDLLLDGKELGDSQIFNLELEPGPHSYVVHHRCCADGAGEFVVTAGKVDQVYKLHYGVPRPARLVLVNAPPDARVLIDGAMAGTAPELPPYLMTDPDRLVTVTIGDRSLQTRLKAGDDNRIDYAQATP